MKKHLLRGAALAALAAALLAVSPSSASAGVAVGLNIVIPAGNPPPPPPAPSVVEPSYYASPEPGMVWINPQWHWNGRSWVWWQGYWEHPPRPHAVWVPGGYVQAHDGYHYRGGHWR
ncbi:MAG: hypothetical protein PW734_03180 [Verrucomicrobium sp.]|nr:hypothetical protein [Verrucomicrobium sp.]